MLIGNLYDILRQWSNSLPLLVDGAEIKRVRYNDKAQVMILDTELTELGKGDTTLWEAD
jgi:hypothetical protein